MGVQGATGILDSDIFSVPPNYCTALEALWHLHRCFDTYLGDDLIPRWLNAAGCIMYCFSDYCKTEEKDSRHWNLYILRERRTDIHDFESLPIRGSSTVLLVKKIGAPVLSLEHREVTGSLER